ncbi:MAG: helix-turn-helix domain-containing protein [Coriobacteriia bacterium]|nr:helix-turn-helix domain-containing protein [Coriobacteriia bacterium]
MENLNQLIGDNLKGIRADKNLSLDNVAKLSGVSKSMLGQIERGEVNPTISILWRIANGLKISFTSLVSRPREDSEIVRRDDVEPLIENAGSVRNYPVFPFDAERGFEMYSLEVDPGGYLQADAHPTGTEEFISVFTGTLSLRVADDEHVLGAGDSIRFRADVPHAYHNPGESELRLAMVIHYPR